MSPAPIGYAFNLTRRTYLATELSIADNHWTRFVGLLGTGVEDFVVNRGLWIFPSRGVHTLGMNFPIDVVYLSGEKEGRKFIVHMEHWLKPWRIAPIRLNAQSILELPKGILASTNTKIGDEIVISNIRDAEEPQPVKDIALGELLGEQLPSEG